MSDWIILPPLDWRKIKTIDTNELQNYFEAWNNQFNSLFNNVFTSEVRGTMIQPAKVALTNFGSATAATITGADISNALLKGVQDFTFQTATGAPAFSATDNDTVAWSAFTLIFSDGSQYPIDAGNTGNVSTSVVSYVYWDKAISLSVLQTTVDFTLTVGDNKKLCCVVWGTSDTAQKAGFVPAVGVFGANSLNILANSVSAASIQAGAVTAAKINVADLSAITTSTGTLTIGSGGYMRMGQTAYNTGTGFWFGDVSGTAKFSIGSSTNSLTWDGSSLNIKGIFSTAASGGRITIGEIAPENLKSYDSVGNTLVYGFASNTLNMTFSSTSAVFNILFGSDFARFAIVGGNMRFTAPQLESGIATGTAPFVVASTTAVSNLNADLLDGNHASAFASSSGANYSNWDTAYSDRMKWDGGSTGLNATTGRASLGLGSLATVNVGQSGSFPDFNANVITVVDGIITAGL